MKPQHAAPLLAIPVLVAAAPAMAAPPVLTTRPALFAGTWYPGDPSELGSLLDKLLESAAPPAISGKPLAVIAPHAGYRFSAPVAAAAYRSLRGQAYKRVIVLAFSHRFAGSYRGVDLPGDLSAYETPLGVVPIDRAAVDALRDKAPFVALPNLQRDEHSLELQIPFLQRTLKGFQLLPLLVGRMNPNDDAVAAAALLPLIDDQTLLVASSDFTHFGPNYDYAPFKDDVESKLRDLADKSAARLQDCDFDGFVAHVAKTGDTICGRGPIALLLRILSMRGGAQALRAATDSSGHQTGDWTNSVTYQSFVFTARKPGFDKTTQTALLKLARETVEAYIRGQKASEVNRADLPADARADGACFVTLQNHGELRGCIGNMQPVGPLFEGVIQNAVNACQDPRFTSNPVTPAELPQIHIEISRLTPFKAVAAPDEIVIGRHGLMIAMGGYRGVLLPQVAYERGWTREEFLAQLCRKAGLPPDSWKKPEARLFSFEAEVFGE